jgi:hypothetical protein
MDFNVKKLAADAGTFLSRAVQVPRRGAGRGRGVPRAWAVGAACGPGGRFLPAPAQPPLPGKRGGAGRARTVLPAGTP